MLAVTDSASTALQDVLKSEQAQGKYLIIFFQGYGWSGPALGMALDESIESLEKLESNGVTAYIDPGLRQALVQFGKINVDFVRQPDGSGGYMIRAGEPGDCSSDGCSGCG